MSDPATQTEPTHTLGPGQADQPFVDRIILEAARAPPFPCYPPAFSLPCSWLALDRREHVPLNFPAARGDTMLTKRPM